MKVILTERVKSLGNIGDICRVAAGHARNFLFPNKLAVLADENSEAQLNNVKKKIAIKVSGQKNQAVGLKAKLELVQLDYIKRVSGNGKLFGTIGPTEISRGLQEKGFDIDKRAVMMDAPIKSLGEFSITVRVFADVDAQIKVKVIVDPNQLKENEENIKQRKAKAILDAEVAKAQAAKEAADLGHLNNEQDS